MTTEAETGGTARAEDARTRLLEATIRTLQEEGRGGATARAITSAAEANLGSIVYYFGSKDELVDAALVAVCERWVGFFKESGLASAAGKTIGERVARSLGAFTSSLPRNRPLALAFVEALASAERSPDVREALRDGYEDLRKTVAEGTETLAEAQTAAETVPSAIVALFDGLLIQLLLEPEREVRPGELTAALGSLFGTALAEASSLSIRPSSLAEGVGGLVDQPDSEDDADGDGGSTGRPRRRRSARGGIYRLMPPRGSRRQTPPRSVVLIQAGKLRGLRTALVAPASTHAPAATFRPEIKLDGEPARVLVERLRAVNRKRLGERVGRLSAHEQHEVDRAMAAVLALG